MAEFQVPVLPTLVLRECHLDEIENNVFSSSCCNFLSSVYLRYEKGQTFDLCLCCRRCSHPQLLFALGLITPTPQTACGQLGIFLSFQIVIDNMTYKFPA
jgi:hypothetical protein